MAIPLLPVELWSIILLLATRSSSLNGLTTVSKIHFQATSWDSPHRAIAAKRTRRSVVLVCRQWNQIATRYLYEYVWFSNPRRQSFDGLREAIRGPVGVGGLGKFVRWISLPFRPEWLSPFFMIQHLPNLEAMTVANTHDWDWDSTSPAIMIPPIVDVFQNLRRVDFFNPGLSELTQFLLFTTSLRYLAIAGSSACSSASPYCVLLPELLTLRLESGAPVRYICAFLRLPKLERLSFDSSLTGLRTVLVTFGRTLTVVELVPLQPRPLLSDARQLVDVFSNCPNLQELNYYIELTMAPRFTQLSTHTSLNCVRLHAGTLGFVSLTGRPLWHHLRSHFSLFSGPTFPSLRRVELYGLWNDVTCDTTNWLDVQAGFADSGCSNELRSLNRQVL